MRSLAAEADTLGGPVLGGTRVGDRSRPHPHSAWSSQGRCDRVTSSGQESSHRLEASLWHRCVEADGERFGWRGLVNDKPDASNRGVDERVLLCCPGGPGAVYWQAEGRGSERIEVVGRVHTQKHRWGPNV